MAAQPASASSASRKADRRTPAKDGLLFRSLRFWAGVVISALFIFLFLRATHLGELRDALRGANYWWLIPSVAVLFVAIMFRCLRW
jgi:glycosyltransferase 2 family protein